jgi:hypothetical protein
VEHGPSLYARLLGERWPELAEPIRLVHSTGSGLSAAGTFQVRHGGGLFTRCLVWLMRLPWPAEAAPVELRVVPADGGERWQRRFAASAFGTRQRSGSDGLLREHAGLLELRFELLSEAGELVYRQASAGLGLGPLFLPLPHFCRPSVAARESAEGDGVRVSVTVSHPCGGLLFAYHGCVHVAEPRG